MAAVSQTDFGNNAANGNSLQLSRLTAKTVVPEIQAAQMVRIHKHILVPAKLMTSQGGAAKDDATNDAADSRDTAKESRRDQQDARNPMLLTCIT